MVAKHINDFPDELLRTILRLSLSPNASLIELVQRGFVCNRWLTVVAELIDTHWLGTGVIVDTPAGNVRLMKQQLPRGRMLKLFESEFQLEVYDDLVIKDAQLHLHDLQMRLNRNLDWRHQDHLCLSAIPNTAIDVLVRGLDAIFDKDDHSITSLVVGTAQLDLVELLKAFPQVDSLTLIELPDSRKTQAELWTYLATRDKIPLRQLHIFHRNGFFPVATEQVAPIFARLQALTMHQYTHSNRAALLNVLSGTNCRKVLLRSRMNVPEDQSYFNPWWGRNNVPLSAPSNLEICHRSKLNWRSKETDFIIEEVAFKRHWPDLEDPHLPFTLSYVQVLHVTAWLKTVAFYVGFGAAAATSFSPEVDFLNFFLPRFLLTHAEPAATAAANPHRQLQKLVHLWRAIIRQLDQTVALWQDEMTRKRKEKSVSIKEDVLITKKQLFRLFIDLYHQFFTGNWQPPLPFYYHSPAMDNGVDPLKPWIVIWMLMHDSFQLGSAAEGGNENDEASSHTTYQTSINGKAFL
ncbi:hypothetical protein TYRP_014251 [Tyrophagus putrescentiae]|nr:hypothetical protein TYRP_014251 [Tyrophagus putrescentiae]